MSGESKKHIRLRPRDGLLMGEFAGFKKSAHFPWQLKFFRATPTQFEFDLHVGICGQSRLQIRCIATSRELTSPVE